MDVWIYHGMKFQFSGRLMALPWVRGSAEIINCDKSLFVHDAVDLIKPRSEEYVY